MSAGFIEKYRKVEVTLVEIINLIKTYTEQTDLANFGIFNFWRKKKKIKKKKAICIAISLTEEYLKMC